MRAALNEMSSIIRDQQTQNKQDSDKFCRYCKRNGHLKEECEKLKRKNLLQNKFTQPRHFQQQWNQPNFSHQHPGYAFHPPTQHQVPGNGQTDLLYTVSGLGEASFQQTIPENIQQPHFQYPNAGCGFNEPRFQQQQPGTQHSDTHESSSTNLNYPHSKPGAVAWKNYRK